jgi:hypothetical protein
MTKPGPKVGYLMTDNGFLLLDHVRMSVTKPIGLYVSHLLKMMQSPQSLPCPLQSGQPRHRRIHKTRKHMTFQFSRHSLISLDYRLILNLPTAP